jgi:Xaa-Pro dipeptidase
MRCELMTFNYEVRLKTLHDEMDRRNLDLIIITNPININYFSGFLSNPHERFMALVVNRNEDKELLFVPSLDFETAEQASYIKSIIAISDSENPYSVLYKKIKIKPINIGVEKNVMSIWDYEKLKGVFTDSNFDNITPFIQSLRLKKTQSEITFIREAIRLVESVLDEGIKNFQIGTSEREIVGELEYLMNRKGVSPSFSTIVLTGKQTSLPHGTPSMNKIKHGDFLLIDMGVNINGYCSDITRTFIIGEASDYQRRIYQTVNEANEKAINAIHIGEQLKEVDLAARNHIEKCGFGAYFNNRVGHGIGLEIHEEPSVHENNDNQIEAGMVFTIEPGIYVPSFGGVRIEDNIFVNYDGKIEVLTNYPKEICIL